IAHSRRLPTWLGPNAVTHCSHSDSPVQAALYCWQAWAAGSDTYRQFCAVDATPIRPHRTPILYAIADNQRQNTNRQDEDSEVAPYGEGPSSQALFKR